MADVGGYSERHGAGFLRAILDRFRGSAGVPAAVSNDVGSELAPLFLLLDSLEAEAERIRSAGLRRARAIAGETHAEVEQVLSEARAQAESERAEAIKAGRRAADAEGRAIEARALREAEEITLAGRARIGSLVAEVLRCVEASPR